MLKPHTPARLPQPRNFPIQTRLQLLSALPVEDFDSGVAGAGGDEVVMDVEAGGGEVGPVFVGGEGCVGRCEGVWGGGVGEAEVVGAELGGGEGVSGYLYEKGGG